MSTKEIAYSIFEQLDEDELEGFIALFHKLHPPKTQENSEKRSPKNTAFREITSPTENMEERRAAFERIEKLRRPIPDLDEKKELAEYREERFGQ